MNQLATQCQNKQKSLLEWSKFYLEEHFSRGYSKFHVTLGYKYDELRKRRGIKTVVIAPRGNAKTTITQASCIRDICETAERYILIVSDTETQAIKILDVIKQELEHNEKLRHDYPLACRKGFEWSKTRIETANGICVEAVGTGQKVRGRKYKHYRPTKIILDDPDNDEDVAHAQTRQNHIEWVDKALSQCGDKDTNFIYVGTMIHRECIVGHLELRPDCEVIKFQAIMKWPTKLHLWSKWESMYLSAPTRVVKGELIRDLNACNKYYIEHKDAMGEGAEVLWEEKESLYDLMTLRAAIGHPAFASEKQNDPRDPSKCEFKEEWFSDDIYYAYEDLLRRISKEKPFSILYGDPAKGKDTQRHDYSPLIQLHRFSNDPYVYIEINMEKLPVTAFTDKFLDIWQSSQPTIGAFEENGFQELIGNEIFDKAQTRNIYNLNLKHFENYNINKLTRISRLSVWLERHFFKFRRDCPFTKLLIQQLKDHPHAAHDDGSDSLECVLRLLNLYLNESDQEQEPTEEVIGHVR